MANFAGLVAVFLSAEGRKVFLRNYELWMRAPYRGRAIFGGLPGQGTASDCWRHALRAQALLVRNAIIHRVLPEWLWSQQSGPEAGLEFAERRKARAPAQSKRAQRKAKVDKKKSDGDSAGDDPE